MATHKNEEEAKAFTPNRSCINQNIKKRGNSANLTGFSIRGTTSMPLESFKTFHQGLNSFERSRQNHQFGGSPDMMIYKTMDG